MPLYIIIILEPTFEPSSYLPFLKFLLRTAPSTGKAIVPLMVQKIATGQISLTSVDGDISNNERVAGVNIFSSQQLLCEKMWKISQFRFLELNCLAHDASANQYFVIIWITALFKTMFTCLLASSCQCLCIATLLAFYHHQLSISKRAWHGRVVKKYSCI